MLAPNTLSSGQQEEQAEKHDRDRADRERKGVAAEEQPHGAAPITTTRCGS